MSYLDPRVQRSEADLVPPASMLRATEDDVPARRLLAHDLPPLVWDDDGDGVLPPPD